MYGGRAAEVRLSRRASVRRDEGRRGADAAAALVVERRSGEPGAHHSLRSATIGSTFVARRAGRNDANSPTTMMTAETLAKVTKSVAATP